MKTLYFLVLLFLSTLAYSGSSSSHKSSNSKHSSSSSHHHHHSGLSTTEKEQAGALALLIIIIVFVVLLIIIAVVYFTFPYPEDEAERSAVLYEIQQDDPELDGLDSVTTEESTYGTRKPYHVELEF